MIDWLLFESCQSRNTFLTKHSNQVECWQHFVEFKEIEIIERELLHSYINLKQFFSCHGRNIRKCMLHEINIHMCMSCNKYFSFKKVCLPLQDNQLSQHLILKDFLQHVRQKKQEVRLHSIVDSVPEYQALQEMLCCCK